MSQLNNLPDVNFIDKDINTLLNNMITEYEKALFEQTGVKKKLYPGDPVRIWIYSQALRIYTSYQLIDFSAKMNLLKYSKGNYLDNIAARTGVIRQEAKKSISTVRFTLSNAQSSVISIYKGTRVTPGNNVFFATKEYAEIPSGNMYIDLEVECIESGIIGNGFSPGQINILVDPINYIDSVLNTVISQGGTEVENDEKLRNRIFLSPKSFSVAGPTGSYEFFTKEFSTLISDVKVTSPNPGEVDIRIILENGEIPNQTFLHNVKNYISDSKRRPLTDKVIVKAPTLINYNIELTYFIKTGDSNTASAIQNEVNKAVNDYIVWQKSKIGRDINPSELISRIIHAGAKRVLITCPSYTAVDNTELAIAAEVNVTYGGLEDE